MEIKTVKKILSFLSVNKTEFLGLVNENTKKFNPIFTKIYGTLIDDKELIVESLKKYEDVKKIVVELVDAWKDSETVAYLRNEIETELNTALTNSPEAQEFQSRLEDYLDGDGSAKSPKYNVSYTTEDGNRMADILRDIESRKDKIRMACVSTKSIIVLKELARTNMTLTNMVEGLILRNGGYDLKNYCDSVTNQLQGVDEDLRRLEIQGLNA